MAAPAHTGDLVRELRRGVSVWADALFVWARAEPDARHAALAREVAKALKRICDALAAWREDGKVVPGDTRAARPSGNRPPHPFTD